MTCAEFKHNPLGSQTLSKMNPLSLSPLPSIRASDESEQLQMEREGFVDEVAVLALMRDSQHLRRTAYPEDLVLTADDSDFAGWQLSTATPSRSPEVPPQVISAIVARATPPRLASPNVVPISSGSYGWWRAGLVAIFGSLLYSLFLISISSRPQVDSKPAVSMEVRALPTTPSSQFSEPQKEFSRDLTDATALQP